MSQQDSLTFKQSEYIAIKSQNDFYQYWLQADKHFTNGFHIEVSNQKLNYKLTKNLLIGLKNIPIQEFALSIGQDLHTPENTQTHLIDSTDRPYSAQLYFSLKRYTSNPWKGTFIKSNIYIGVQGPSAGGEQVQNFMHSLFLDNNQINGWSNQIQNGLVLDYDLLYQKQLPLTTTWLETNSFLKGHVGTIYNYILTGLKLKIGKFNDTYLSSEGTPYSANIEKHNSNDFSKTRLKQLSKNNTLTNLIKNGKNKAQYYFFSEFHLGYLFYDGTAQGSLIQFKSSPYVLTQDQINNHVVNVVYGTCFSYKKWMLRYYRVIENSNFSKNNLVGWGEVSLYYSL